MAEQIRIPLDFETSTAYGTIDRMAAYTQKRFANIKLGAAGAGASGNPFAELDRSTRSFSKTLQFANDRMIAFGATTSIVYGLGSAFSSLASNAIKAEKALAEIQVNVKLTSEEMTALTASLFKTANQTGQSFYAAAEAAAEFGRQGLKAADIAKATSAALVLSQISGMEAADSVKALTSAINTFGKNAVDYEMLVNKMAAADTSFAVSSKDIAQAISRVGSTAKDAGVNIDQLIALVTSLQQSTARGGAVIGNSLKTIFTRLQRDDVASAIENIGIKTKDADGKFLNQIGVLTQLAQVYDKLGDSQKSSISEKLGGVYQINIVKGIIQDLQKSSSVFSQAMGIVSAAESEAFTKSEFLARTTVNRINEAKNSFVQLSEAIGKLGGTSAIGDIASQFSSAISGAAGNLNNKDNASLGEKFGQSMVRGLINSLSGPGVGMALVGITRLAGTVLNRFGRDLGGTFFGQGTQSLRAHSQLQVENNRLESIAIQNQKQYNQTLLSGNQTLAQRVALLSRMSVGTMGMPVIPASFSSTAMPKAAFRTPMAVRRGANGVIPAMHREAADVAMGVGGARPTARPVAKKIRMSRGANPETVVVNTDEYLVRDYMGTGADAVFNKQMVKQIGGFHNLGTMGRVEHIAGGVVPNYAIARIGPKIDPRAKRIRGTSLGGGVDGKFYVATGYVPNYAKSRITGEPYGNPLGKGIDGTFLSLESRAGIQRRTGVGVKQFKDSASDEKIIKEYAYTKFLSEKEILPGVSSPGALGSLKNSVLRKRVGKEVVKGSMLSDLEADDHLGWKIEELFRKRGVPAADLHGNNIMLNDKAVDFFKNKRNMSILEGRRPFDDKGQKSLLNLLSRMHKKGGQIKIIDTGHFGEPSSYKSLLELRSMDRTPRYHNPGTSVSMRLSFSRNITPFPGNTVFSGGYVPSFAGGTPGKSLLTLTQAKKLARMSGSRLSRKEKDAFFGFDENNTGMINVPRKQKNPFFTFLHEAGHEKDFQLNPDRMVGGWNRIVGIEESLFGENAISRTSEQYYTDQLKISSAKIPAEKRANTFVRAALRQVGAKNAIPKYNKTSKEWYKSYSDNFTSNLLRSHLGTSLSFKDINRPYGSGFNQKNKKGLANIGINPNFANGYVPNYASSRVRITSDMLKDLMMENTKFQSFDYFSKTANGIKTISSAQHSSLVGHKDKVGAPPPSGYDSWRDFQIKNRMVTVKSGPVIKNIKWDAIRALRANDTDYDVVKQLAHGFVPSFAYGGISNSAISSYTFEKKPYIPTSFRKENLLKYIREGVFPSAVVNEEVRKSGLLSDPTMIKARGGIDVGMMHTPALKIAAENKVNYFPKTVSARARQEYESRVAARKERHAALREIIANERQVVRPLAERNRQVDAYELNKSTSTDFHNRIAEATTQGQTISNKEVRQHASAAIKSTGGQLTQKEVNTKLKQARQARWQRHSGKMGGAAMGAVMGGSMIGDMVGSPALGGGLSAIGLGVSVGSAFGPWGTAIGAAVGSITALSSWAKKTSIKMEEFQKTIESASSELEKNQSGIQNFFSAQENMQKVIQDPTSTTLSVKNANRQRAMALSELPEDIRKQMLSAKTDTERSDIASGFLQKEGARFNTTASLGGIVSNAEKSNNSAVGLFWRKMTRSKEEGAMNIDREKLGKSMNTLVANYDLEGLKEKAGKTGTRESIGAKKALEAYNKGDFMSFMENNRGLGLIDENARKDVLSTAKDITPAELVYAMTVATERAKEIQEAMEESRNAAQQTKVALEDFSNFQRSFNVKNILQGSKESIFNSLSSARMGIISNRSGTPDFIKQSFEYGQTQLDINNRGRQLDLESSGKIMEILGESIRGPGKNKLNEAAKDENFVADLMRDINEDKDPNKIIENLIKIGEAKNERGERIGALTSNTEDGQKKGQLETLKELLATNQGMRAQMLADSQIAREQLQAALEMSRKQKFDKIVESLRTRDVSKTAIDNLQFEKIRTRIFSPSFSEKKKEADRLNVGRLNNSSTAAYQIGQEKVARAKAFLESDKARKALGLEGASTRELFTQNQTIRQNVNANQFKTESDIVGAGVKDSTDISARRAIKEAQDMVLGGKNPGSTKQMLQGIDRLEQYEKSILDPKNKTKIGFRQLINSQKQAVGSQIGASGVYKNEDARIATEISNIATESKKTPEGETAEQGVKRREEAIKKSERLAEAKRRLGFGDAKGAISLLGKDLPEVSNSLKKTKNADKELAKSQYEADKIANGEANLADLFGKSAEKLSGSQDLLTRATKSLQLSIEGLTIRMGGEAEIAGSAVKLKDIEAKKAELEREDKETRAKLVSKDGATPDDWKRSGLASNSQEVKDAVKYAGIDSAKMNRNTDASVIEAASILQKVVSFGRLNVNGKPTDKATPEDVSSVRENFDKVRSWAKENNPSLIEGLDRFGSEILPPLEKEVSKNGITKEEQAGLDANQDKLRELEGTLAGYKDVVESARTQMEEMLRQNREKSNTIDKGSNPKTPETSKPRDPLTETASSLKLGDTETREQTQARIARLWRDKQNAEVKRDSLKAQGFDENKKNEKSLNDESTWTPIQAAAKSKEVKGALSLVGVRPIDQIDQIDNVGNGLINNDAANSAKELLDISKTGTTKAGKFGSPSRAQAQFGEVREWAAQNNPSLLKGLDKYNQDVLGPIIKKDTQREEVHDFRSRKDKLDKAIESYTEAIKKAAEKLVGGERNKGKEAEPANKGNGPVTKNETTANINLNAMGLPEKFLDAFGSIVVQEVRRQIISSKEHPVAFNADVIPRETANA